MGAPKKLKLRRKDKRSPSTNGPSSAIFEGLSIDRAVEISLQPTIVTDSCRRIIALNHRAADLLGYDRLKLIGAPLDTVVSVAAAAGVSAGGNDDASATSTSTTTAIEVRHKNGNVIHANASIQMIEGRDGQAMVTTILDTGEFGDEPTDGGHRWLTSHQKTLADVLNNAPVAYHSLDEQGRVIDVNETWLDRMGYDRTEVLGRSFGDFLEPGQVKFFHDNFPRFKKRGQLSRAEVRMVRSDGNHLVAVFECRAVYNESGEFVHSHCTFRDITKQKHMESALSESEERFRVLAEVSPEAICVHLNGKIGFVNQAAVRLLGATNSGELVGRNMLDFVHPDYREGAAERHAMVVRTGEEIPYAEQKMVRLDGRILDAEVASVPLPYSGDKAVQTVVRDITERKIIDRALRSSERRYRTIVQNQTELVCRWTPDGRLTFVNESYACYFGKTADELIGSCFMSLIPASDHESVEEHFESFTPKSPLQTHEHRVLAADGELHWQQWTNRAIFDGDGNLVEVLSVGRDITKLKEAEETLQYRLEFERIVMSLSARFISIAPEEIDANVVEVLKTIGEFTGADRCYVFTLSDDGQTMSNTHEWCAGGITPHIDELQGLSTDAYAYLFRVMRKENLFHIPRVADLPTDAAVEKAEFERENIKSIICVPVNRRDQLVGFIGFDSVRREKEWSADEIALLRVVGETLTTALDRGKTERALRNSEEKYRTFVQGFQGIAYRARMDWIPLFFHGAVEEITGYAAEEFTSGSPRWDQIIHPPDFEAMRESVDKIATVPNYSVEREYRIIHKNGDLRWVRELSQNTCDDRGNPNRVQGTIYDITEHRRAQEALEASEERFRTVADFTYDWEYWIGTDGRCIYVTPSCESTTGYTPEEFVDNPQLLRQIVHPDDISVLDQHLNDGVEAGQVTSIDFRIRTRDGDERWINHVCQPVYGEGGHYLGRRASNRDITDRKAAEDAVRKERDRTQRYLDVAGTILLAIDVEGRVILINRKGCEVLGYEEIHVVGTNWFDDYLPARVRNDARRAFGHMMSGDTGVSEYYESCVLTRKGEERTVAWYNTILRDEKGEIRGTLSSGLDITERKRMEKMQSALFAISEATNLSENLEELLETIRAILGTLIDTTNFYVALYNEAEDTYTFPYIVDQYNEPSPTSSEELKKTLTDYVRRTGRPLLADGTIDKKLESAGEVEVVGRPSEVWLGVPLKTAHGVLGVVAVQSYTDPDLYEESDMDLMTFVSGHITMAIERKLADDALRQSELEHRSLVETMSEGLVVRDTGGIVTFANKRFCDMLAISRREVIGSNLRNVLDEPNWQIISRNFQSRQDGVYESYELQWRRSDGDTVTTIVSPEAVRDADGNVIGSFSVITDISDWKRAEAKLRQASELLRTEREALTQKNIALKEILEHIEQERKDYKQRICQDVQHALGPFLSRLKALAQPGRARETEALQTQLDAILARDVDSFRDRYATLTPRELEICDLIKSKKSSKEISERLNLSLLTVHKHREQIRRKLGLTSKGINLSIYLQSH